ncbi:MAG: GspE/PulE family protein [Candidatus Jorgensenbacteria bacterium]|nr:GspE/PulE family protein [Candidatus Jorgensenbacteria bacterium]
MTDQELFKALVERGIVEQSVASRIFSTAQYSNRPPEDLLYDEHAGDEVEIAKVKAELTGAPYKKVNAAAIPDDVLKLIPQETSTTYKVAPLEKRQGMLVVGMFRPDDERAQEALRFIAKQSGLSLGVYLITLSDLNAVWRRYAPYKDEIAAAVSEIGKDAKEDKGVELEEGGSQEDAPIIKIVASTLRQAVETGASDIHIEPQRTRLRVRFRTDGDLKEVASLPSSLVQPVVSRVKVLAKLKLDENRIPQDGRFRTFLFGRDIDYRVATFPTPAGEKVAIRVLDPKTGLRGLSSLGLSDYNLKIISEGTSRPYGMILISGPTGSGKTTTLYAIMQQLNKDTVNVVSLEDPVEYFMEGINQSQVKPEIGYTFASGLRQILRQDPDVIMVGEIRDSETANLAVNAALTGHVVLSTIHTNNSIGVPPRLVDLGVPPFLLSSALNIMIAQRLVLRLCPECKEKFTAAKEMEEIIEETLKELPKEARVGIKQTSAPFTLYKTGNKPDCKTCKGKGVSGRVAIVEIFKMTPELGDLISSGFTEGKLWAEAKRQGMMTLRQDGVIKALLGEVSLEQVIQEST